MRPCHPTAGQYHNLRWHESQSSLISSILQSPSQRVGRTLARRTPRRAQSACIGLMQMRPLVQGQTDLNPTSAIGKLSQVVFAIISPGRVVANIVAGAIAEAGAQQAGDMMQVKSTEVLPGTPHMAVLRRRAALRPQSSP